MSANGEMDELSNSFDNAALCDSGEQACACAGTCATVATASEEACEAWQCAICLEDMSPENVAIVKGCNHSYCVCCILKWASSRYHNNQDPPCPTCKKPFRKLLVHRTIDGELTDMPIEETFVLLARSTWYQEWLGQQTQLQELSKFAAFRSVELAESERSPLSLAQEDWAEEMMYSYFEDQYEDDDLEDMYMSRGASTSARPVFGNRRWGANGYVRNGRRQARPVQQPRAAGKPGGSKAGLPKSQGAGQQKGEASGTAGGRRAKRRAKRAAADHNSGVPGFD